MEISNEQLKELIARRLMDQAEADVKRKPNQQIGKSVATLEQPQEQVSNISSQDFIAVEKNLASLGFFTPSSKKLPVAKKKTITFTKMIEGKKVEVRAVILPSAEYGLPTTADQDKYFALQKILTDLRQRGLEICNPFGFSSAELLRLLGKRITTGKNYDDIAEWLQRMTLTGIRSEGTVYFAGRKVYATDTFHVIDRAVYFGSELPDGTIADRNYVWFSEWQLENIKHNHILPIDFDAYKQLKNHIAKALVPLLQIWLYATREDGSFEKRYEELCQVLNIHLYQQISRIKEQLAPSLDELKEHGYIAEWKIEKTSDKKAYKIIFAHGEKFHRDRRKRLGYKETTGAVSTEEKAQEPEQGSETPSKNSAEVKQDQALTLTNEQSQLVQKLFSDFKVAISKATELATKHFEETKLQIEAYPHRGVTPKNPAGFIIHAIETSYAPPEAYLEVKEKAAAREKYEARQAAIAACTFCKESSGYRITEKGARPCTHDPKIEANYTPA